MPARLTKMGFDEVSLVRRGANQHADVVLFKMDTSDDIDKACSHENMGTKDAKCPDCGAKNEPHMNNKGKGKPVLGEDGKPVGKLFGQRVWDAIMKGQPSATDAHVKKPLGADDETDDEEDPLGGRTYVRPPGKGVTKSGHNGDAKEKPMLKSELPESIAKHVEGDDDAEVTPEALADAIGKRDDEVADFIVKSAEPKDEPKTALAKAMEDPAVREVIEKAQSDAAAAIEIAKDERDRRETAEFVAKAEEFGALPIEADKLGPVLKRLHESSPEDYAAVVDVLKSGDAAASMLFKEIGAPAPSSMEGQSESAIEKAAAEIRKDEPDLTPEQAYDKALQQNPKLYAETLEG